jgi:uncharacterized membrane protein YheB (UPF0754 family)
MAFLLGWIMPIALGAIIGYVTNDIAIKMLFKPLTEKHLGRWRLPFTPGILPKNRHRLALSLGSIVSRELLNQEVLTQRFQADDFRASIFSAVHKLLDYILDSPLSEIRLSSQDKTQADIQNIARNLLARLLDAEGIPAGLLAAGRLGAKGLGALEFLPRDGKSDAEVAEGVLAWLAQPERTTRVRRKISLALHRLRRREEPLSALVPLDADALARFAATRLYPPLLDALVALLRDPALSAELEGQGKVLVSHLLQKLNRVQRFFVTAAQYDKAIKANMGSTIAELLDFIETKGKTARTLSEIERRLAGWLNATLALSPSQIEARYPGLGERLLGLYDRALSALNSTRRAEIGALAESACRALRGKSIYDFASIATTREDAEKFVADLIGRLLLQAHAAGRIKAVALNSLDTLWARKKNSTLGDMLGMTAERRNGVCAFVSDELISLLCVKVGEIIKTVDVERTVVEKIDSLDMKTVEKIVLDVMKEEFAWINILGAVLGGLIGLIQACFRLVLG